VVRGPGVLLPFAADEGAVLHAGDVVHIGAVQIAARQLFAVELDKYSLFDGLAAQLLELLLASVDPDDAVGARERGDAVYPLGDVSVIGRFHYVSPSYEIFTNNLIKGYHITAFFTIDFNYKSAAVQCPDAVGYLCKLINIQLFTAYFRGKSTI
jgi:hypothetical protein